PFGFGVLHLGDHNLTGGVREYDDGEQFGRSTESLHAAFGRADTAELIGLLNQSFENNIYSLKSMFRDDQRNILDIILKSNLSEAEATLLHQYEQDAPLMWFLADLHVEQPKLFRMLAEFALNNQLRDALAKDNISAERVQSLLQEAA